MSRSVLQLRDSEVDALENVGSAVRIRFSPALVLKSEGVPGVDASTLWHQSALLTIKEGEIEGQRVSLPRRLAGGRITVNRLSYVDLLPIPLGSTGFVQLVLTFDAPQQHVIIAGTSANLDLLGHGKYIEHLAPG